MKLVYLLWTQHYDKSGEAFVGVYELKEDADADKERMLKGCPSMEIKVSELELVEARDVTV